MLPQGFFFPFRTEKLGSVPKAFGTDGTAQSRKPSGGEEVALILLKVLTLPVGTFFMYLPDATAWLLLPIPNKEVKLRPEGFRDRWYCTIPKAFGGE
jgi:hypothetical protein